MSVEERTDIARAIKPIALTSALGGCSRRCAFRSTGANEQVPGSRLTRKGGLVVCWRREYSCARRTLTCMVAASSCTRAAFVACRTQFQSSSALGKAPFALHRLRATSATLSSSNARPELVVNMMVLYCTRTVALNCRIGVPVASRPVVLMVGELTVTSARSAACAPAMLKAPMAMIVGIEVHMAWSS